MKTNKLIMLILLIGGLFMNACKGKTSDYELSRSDSRDTTSAKMADTTGNIPKLVKTADIRFKVKNVQQTSENIAALTTKFNGLVVHDEMTSDAGQTNDISLINDSVMRVSAINTHAEMVVKIPSGKIEDFLNSISHLSIYVNLRQMDIEDKSLDYLAAKLKLNNRRELVAQEKNRKVVIKDPNAVLNLKDDLVDEQVNNKMIDEQVKYSTISMSFYQSNTISKEIVANDDPSTYHLPFFTQLAMAFNNGWRLFTPIVLGVANLWMFILCGAGIWLLCRGYYKRKGNLAR